MKVQGFTITPSGDPAKLATAFRFYGTRETVEDDAGRERPHPNRWQLVREVRMERDGDTLTLPDFDLPRTEPGRWRFYYPVTVFADGRELWHADEEITMPRACVETLGEHLNFTTLLLWNLEQKGVIAPGQLFD
jgi:hypothetical protein